MATSDYERRATKVLRRELHARGCATKSWTWTGYWEGDARYLGSLMDGRTRPPEDDAIKATREQLKRDAKRG